MTDTLLQRIHRLAAADTSVPHYATTAKILRKLYSCSDVADVAHTITGALRKLPDAEQERIVAAVESLRAEQ